MANYSHPASTNDFFLPLDNSAVFIAATTVKRSPYIFRISCQLDEAVRLPELEKALSQTSNRYPFVKTRLRAGVFWYYLDPIHNPPVITADNEDPCGGPGFIVWKSGLVRVMVYSRTISCEFHHILTDGSGAVEFLRTLIAAYLTECGTLCADWGDIKHPESTVNPSELEDAYDQLFQEEVPNPEPLPVAYHIGGKRLRAQEFKVINGTFSVAKTLTTARSMGVTITELLTAIYMCTLQELAERPGEGPFLPLCIQIPVNMRKMHPSETLRNFFLFVPVTLDRRLGHYTFQEILSRVQYCIRTGHDMREMRRQIHRNVRGERWLLPRAVPLFIKNLYLRRMGEKMTEARFSGNLSNLQAVKMPPEFAGKITRFDIIPQRRERVGVGIGIISFNDVLSVSIGSKIEDTEFEKIFFRKCSEAGLEAIVTVNR